MSRASRELSDAPGAYCPSCGRETKTVQGVCAECWRAKEPGAYEVFRSEPRTWRIFDFWELDDLGTWVVISVGVAAVGAVVAAVLRFALS